MSLYLKNLISVPRLAESIKNDSVIIDCRHSLMNSEQGRVDFTESHIPGAIHAHLDNDLSSPITDSSGRHPLPKPKDFERCLTSWGVSTNTPVVVYDYGNSAIAARLWWMMRWIGHHNVVVLDGGFDKWSKEGCAIESGQITHNETSKYKAQPDNEKWLKTNDIRNRSDDMQLLDAREKDRYDGKIEPIDCIAGHIPGAISAPFMHNLNPDNTFLPVDKLRHRFEHLLGDQKGDYSKIIHSCGSGVTACHNLLAMEIAGMAGSKLYVGSWSAWITDTSRPIA